MKRTSFGEIAIFPGKDMQKSTQKKFRSDYFSLRFKSSTCNQTYKIQKASGVYRVVCFGLLSCLKEQIVAHFQFFSVLLS